MLAIFNKELKSYFSSATGYIFLAVFLFICGIFFALTNLLTSSPNANYSSVLGSITFVFLLLVPILTMKTFSEETHQKTDQLLLTAPVKLYEVVLGKYFAAVVLFLIALLITCLYPLILSMFGSVAGWEVLGSYVGFALFGSALIAVGIFISSLTESQVIAAVGTFGCVLVFWIMDAIKQSIPTTRMAGIIFALVLAVTIGLIIYFATHNAYLAGGIFVAEGIAVLVIYLVKKTLFEGFTAKFFDWFSLLSRYDNFSMGILDVSSIVYYITFSAAFVFITIRMIDKRRWS